MTQRFEIQGRLPGANEYTAANRRDRHAGAKLKREAQQQVAEAIDEAGLVPMQPPVFVRFTWVEPNMRRDPDNVAFARKFVFDALVERGILGNDNWAWVDGFADSFRVNAANPRIVVEIEGREKGAEDGRD